MYYFRRYFYKELLSHTIRLIFQGKILNDNKATLSSCGFYDDCVIHCIMNQKLTIINIQPNQNSVDNNSDDSNEGINTIHYDINDERNLQILFCVVS